MAAIYTLHQTEASSTQLLGNGLNYKSKALLGIRKISGIHRRSLPHDKGADEKKKKKNTKPTYQSHYFRSKKTFIRRTVP